MQNKKTNFIKESRMLFFERQQNNPKTQKASTDTSDTNIHTDLKNKYSDLTEGVEKKEELTEDQEKAQKIFNKSLGLWTALLVDSVLSNEKTSLPKHLESHEVRYQTIIQTLPFALLLTIIGCTNSYEQFEGCTEDQERLIKAAIKFLRTNKSGIQKKNG